jgi:hypothetical protein
MLENAAAALQEWESAYEVYRQQEDYQHKAPMKF